MAHKTDTTRDFEDLASEELDAFDDLEDLDDFVDTQLQDPLFARALEDAEAKAAVLRKLTALRKAVGMTQAQAALMMGTVQSAVSDLEGGVTDPYLSTLQRYARAIGARMVVSVVPPDDRHFVPCFAVPARLTSFAEEWGRGAAETRGYLQSVERQLAHR